MIGRIAILGGSSVYTPEFVLSLMAHNLPVKELVLVGRNEAKLNIVTKFCQRMLRRTGYPLQVTGTRNVEEGVGGANYILNCVRAGGMQARLRDEKLPPKYGFIGDETMGAGGISNALRTLPVVLDYAKKIERVNPDAVFINLTNPMGVVVEALSKYSKLKAIGVCDLPVITVKKIEELLGRESDSLHIDYIGLNHTGWIQDVRSGNRSLMPNLLDILERKKDDFFDLDLVSTFRMIPTRTTAMYYRREEILQKQQTQSRFRAESLHEAEQEILKIYQDERVHELPELARQRNALWYKEIITPLIAAMEGRKEHSFILCLRNEGAISDMPMDASVEIPVSVCKRGLAPRKPGALPRTVSGVIQAVKESERLTIEAVVHKSYDSALQALAVHPLVSSIGKARQYLDQVVKEEGIELH